MACFDLTLFGIPYLTQTLFLLNIDIFVYIVRKRLLPTWYNLKDTRVPRAPPSKDNLGTWILTIEVLLWILAESPEKKKIVQNLSLAGVTCVHFCASRIYRKQVNSYS